MTVAVRGPKEIIAEIDQRLETLRPRLAASREEVARLIEKENRDVRLFVDEEDRHKKAELDRQIFAIVEQRATQERDAKGLAMAVAELEESRRQIYPELEAMVLAEQRQERARKIELLRLAHERDQTAERAADQALMAAREKTNRSYQAWRFAKEQEAADELAAATELQKQEWQKNAGPNSPLNQRRVN
jgi:hypothetical protein